MKIKRARKKFSPHKLVSLTKWWVTQ